MNKDIRSGSASFLRHLAPWWDYRRKRFWLLVALVIYTLAGFLLVRFQHIPSPGEALRWKGFRFNILSMDGPRIERVQILPTAGETAVEPD